MIFAPEANSDSARAEGEVPIYPLESSDHETHDRTVCILPRALGRTIWVSASKTSLQELRVTDDFLN